MNASTLPPKKRTGQIKEGILLGSSNMMDESTNDGYNQETINNLKLLENTSNEENKSLVENEMDNEVSKFSNKPDTQTEEDVSKKFQNSNKETKSLLEPVVVEENTINPLDNQGSKIKNNFETVSLWQHNYNLFRAKSDGRCGAHCFAKHVYNDATKEKVVMHELNSHIIQNWDFFKSSFSFPYAHPIGVGNKDKIFRNESELKSFIKDNHEALNMWMDHQWLTAASSLYGVQINILTTGV